ncbi:MAG: hypothetical protein QM757_44105 [Paludibaculum sp.]
MPDLDDHIRLSSYQFLSTWRLHWIRYGRIGVASYLPQEYSPHELE